MKYTTIIEEGLSFGDAMNALMKGRKVTRVVWGGYWCKQVLLGKQDTKLPEWSGQFVVAALKEGGYAPAQPYQADMFANDWMVVE
ncbi:Thoeris anti-defense Tad2 family protein [Bacillus cereus]|uniref:Thoeris anti-defense Tad2 family protein n=1 Tax=Bacillus cereus TaxID=1396 RepID=UPI0027DE2AF8|nr:MW1434 family type I TA system toxin [Bacillus cereus]